MCVCGGADGVGMVCRRQKFNGYIEIEIPSSNINGDIKHVDGSMDLELKLRKIWVEETYLGVTLFKQKLKPQVCLKYSRETEH